MSYEHYVKTWRVSKIIVGLTRNEIEGQPTANEFRKGPLTQHKEDNKRLDYIKQKEASKFFQYKRISFF